ncbi:ABC transporter ATP-binding protein [Mycetocola sp.]|uniref:ABC transporter ATP-binding protein n=1 Tax=Mycetocola sp. TaxID=1871042 RepID=UPI003988A7FB
MTLIDEFTSSDSRDITVTGLTKSFGRTTALRGVDVTIPHGSLTVIVGPSGCGKSTLLRVLAGLEPASGGSLLIGDEDVTSNPNRDLAMVFQDYALYPHMTVARNIGFGLRMASKHGRIERLNSAEITHRTTQVADLLGLGPMLGRKPQQLSGGQQQRVALARAIVRRPSVLLLDEPLSALDAQLRAEARILISDLHRELGATMVMVTHDQYEALSMATHLVVMQDGIVLQSGSPDEVYNAPADRFVASFVGNPPMNFHDAPGGASVGWRSNAYRHLAIDDIAPTDALVVEGEVIGREFYGDSQSVRCRRVDASGEDFQLVQQNGQHWDRLGERVRVVVDADRLHRFDSSGQRTAPAEMAVSR